MLIQIGDLASTGEYRAKGELFLSVRITGQPPAYSHEDFEDDLAQLLGLVSRLRPPVQLEFGRGGAYVLPHWFRTLCELQGIAIEIQGGPVENLQPEHYQGRRAFMLRIAPGGEDMVPEALESDELIIGWAEASGLLNPDLTWEQFREIVRLAYYRDDQTLRLAGSSAGHLWRFLRDMQLGDLVVVPHHDEIFVAEVLGPATYDPLLVNQDSAYRRPVRWLTDRTTGLRAIPRYRAGPQLAATMKSQGTCCDATPAMSDILLLV